VSTPGARPFGVPAEVDRLVLVNSTGNVSGAEVVLLQLVELALDRGLEVLVASPDGPLTTRLPAAVTHLELPTLGLGGPSSRPGRAWAGARLGVRSARAARMLRPVVSVPGTRTVVNSLLALPAARLARPAGGIRWLVHDTVHQSKQRLVVRLSRHQVHRAVAVSEATALPLRELQLDVAVAHNGVRWPVAAAALAPHEPPVVGMLALLTPWKGQQVLLEAVARLPGVHLELAGGSFPHDDGYVAGLRRRAEQPDLRGRVRFLGHVEPLGTMGQWDVAVSASVTPEAGPIAVLQAMSLGLPVVGTDHGGTAEFLANGAGLLVPPADSDALAAALRQALSDDDFRRASCAAGRERIAAYHRLPDTLPVMLSALLAS